MLLYCQTDGKGGEAASCQFDFGDGRPLVHYSAGFARIVAGGLPPEFGFTAIIGVPAAGGEFKGTQRGFEAGAVVLRPADGIGNGQTLDPAEAGAMQLVPVRIEVDPALL